LALPVTATTSPLSTLSTTPPQRRQVKGPFVTAQNKPIALSSTGAEPAILILDYGVETEGIPAFDVVSAVGDTSVFEATYSETKAALDLYMVRVVFT